MSVETKSPVRASLTVCLHEDGTITALQEGGCADLEIAARRVLDGNRAAGNDWNRCRFPPTVSVTQN